MLDQSDARERLRRLIEKNPEMGSKQIYDMAVRMDPSLRTEPLRTFHARYVLPVRRAQAVAEGRPRKPRTPRKKPLSAVAEGPQSAGEKRGRRSDQEIAAAAAAERTRIRSVLLSFARELAAAESRAQIVGVITDVDRYVSQILEPAGGAPAAESESATE
jgi:hypothetical protein